MPISSATTEVLPLCPLPQQLSTQPTGFLSLHLLEALGGCLSQDLSWRLFCLYLGSVAALGFSSFINSLSRDKRVTVPWEITTKRKEGYLGIALI